MFIIASALGVDQFGWYAIGATCVALMKILSAAAGHNLLLINDGSAPTSESPPARYLYMPILRLSGATSLLVLACGVAIALLLERQVRFSLTEMLLISAAGATGFVQIIRRNLELQEHYDLVAYAAISANLTGLVMRLSVAFLLQEGQLITGFFAVLVLEPLLFTVLLKLYRGIASTAPDAYSVPNGDIRSAREFVAPATILVVASVFDTVYLRIDEFMMMGMTTPVETSLYAFAARISEMCNILGSVFLIVVAPRLKERVANNEFVNKTISIALTLGLIFAMSSIAVICVFDSLLLKIVGPAFAGFEKVFYVHVWSVIFVLLGGLGTLLLNITDQPRRILKVTVVGAAANVVMNLLAIPVYGALGAAWATCFSYAVVAIATIVLFKNTAL